MKRVGVIGYSSGKFDEQQAAKILYSTLLDLKNEYNEITIVSGLTNLGIPALAYTFAKEHGLKTVGIACAKATEYECFPVDEKVIVGDEWGDESETFLWTIDILVRVGGGKQSFDEVAKFLAIDGRWWDLFEHELEREEEMSIIDPEKAAILDVLNQSAVCDLPADDEMFIAADKKDVVLPTEEERKIYETQAERQSVWLADGFGNKHKSPIDVWVTEGSAIEPEQALSAQQVFDYIMQSKGEQYTLDRLLSLV